MIHSVVKRWCPAYIGWYPMKMLQRLQSAIIALKVPTKRWLESDSVIKEAQNHQRYQLDEDNGRFMQLQQDQLNLFVITASYYMTRIFTTFTFKWNKATRHIFQKSCWLELWHDLWPCWLWIKILKDLLRIWRILKLNLNDWNLTITNFSLQIALLLRPIEFELII